MPNPHSVDERLEAQFSSWDIAPAAEIPELLFALRTHGTTITLFKDQVQQAFTAHVTQLEANSIRLTLQNYPFGSNPFQFDGKVLCVGYGKNYSICFVANVTAVEVDTIEVSYPTAVRIRKDRMHERFPLKVPVSVQWDKNTHGVIFGEVMDISLGGFLEGMNVATFNDSPRTFHCGEKGKVTLIKVDGQQWVGSAELRRAEMITADDSDANDVSGPIRGFFLLGFSFLINGPEDTLSLGQFLEGTLDID
ncbi:MAG: PilZ domain-containing protein [Acidithiobacillus ferrivorans]